MNLRQGPLSDAIGKGWCLVHNFAEAESKLQKLAAQNQGSPIDAAVRAALEKLQSGGYGICELCGSSMDEQLLAQMPWARSCGRCQNSIETQEIPAQIVAALRVDPEPT